ncbi:MULTISPECIES: hypothetical protein [unclassified Streptomyces]|uniref:hypothetical protein n=1 Tax=unclassified Streptomyces TaxID=2593676 RepID=UPI003402A744
MISASDVPHFTGNLEQLELHASGLRTRAGALRQAGSVAHSRFQGLEAFYRAPEAEELFASTAPVRDLADLFASKVETVAGALDEYAGAVRPIVARLESLRGRVAGFVAGLKTDGGEIDDEWTKDHKKIAQHQALWDEISQAQADFTAAETAANNKITALVDGSQYVPEGYEGTFVPRGAQVYGYTAEALKHADQLPWGTPEAETYGKFEFSHHLEEARVSIKDNVVGTVTGVIDLVSSGSDGDAARKGLLMSALGLESYVFDPLNQQDSPWKKKIGEGRPYAKAFAKGLVGWDDWEEHPGKATGTVIFNALTFASGPLAAVSRVAKGGTVARTAGALAKVGELVDPISATAKTVGAAVRAAPRIADVTARVRSGFGNVPRVGSTSSVWRISSTTELHLADGKFVVMKDGVPDTTPAPVEHAADARTPSVAVPREHQLVGAGARAPGARLTAGENLPPQANHGSHDDSSSQGQGPSSSSDQTHHGATSGQTSQDGSSSDVSSNPDASGSSSGSDGTAPPSTPDASSTPPPLDPQVVADRIKELDELQGGEGHAPGRHLYPDDATLQKRLGTVATDSNGAPKVYGPNSSAPGLLKSKDNIDPLTGTTVDGISGRAHRVGPFATRFNNAEDMVRVDTYFREEITKTGTPPPETSIEKILGPDGYKRFTGYYRNPANPSEFLPVNFEAGTIKPVYQIKDGKWELVTMYANPAPGRHP